MEHKGYVTETGRVVRQIKQPMDRGLAATGVRWSADILFEEIIGSIWRHKSGLRGSAPIWIVRAFPPTATTREVREITRGAAVATFMADRPKP